MVNPLGRGWGEGEYTFTGEKEMGCSYVAASIHGSYYK